MPELNLPEAVAISMNPYAVLIRNRKDCGLPGDGFVAALSTEFRKHINPTSYIFALGTTDMHLMNFQTISPVTEAEWPKLRTKLASDAAQAGLDQFSSFSTLTYDEMMVSGFQTLLDNRDDFEACTFPNMFPHGIGFYCMARPTPLFFNEYYQHTARVSTFHPVSHANYYVWCRLIEKAAQICERKLREGSLSERRQFPFLSQCCAICGPKTEPVKNCSRCHMISYCGRNHQLEDFEVHKKRCKKFKQPGDPL